MKKITGIMLAAQAAAIIMTGCGGGAAQTAPLEEAAPATAEEAVTEEAAPEEAPEAVSEEEAVTEAAADAVEPQALWKPKARGQPMRIRRVFRFMLIREQRNTWV